MNTQIKKSFHQSITIKDTGQKPWMQYIEYDQTSYSFVNFFHPFVGDFVERLNKGELSGFMRSDLELANPPVEYFDDTYNVPDDYKRPLSSIKVEGFPKAVDFSVGGPYAIYNWEIFYHIPITVAVHLSKNQRFAEAQRWFHFVFNPLTDEKEDSANPTARYWNFKDFRDHTDPKLITTLLEELSKGQESDEIEQLKKSIEEWKKRPFSPHEVAKFRPLAYQFDVVMKYIDNLIAWGDSLFRQFTIETLNEATQLYILAANILGDKPQQIPKTSKRTPKTYKDLKEQLDEFGNAMVEMENEFPLNASIPSGRNTDEAGTGSLFNMSPQLYFCIPENKKLLAYWDLVSDRLFKIRHCMDIEGNVRQIPLFQPPIDPGMLVKAAASGMSIGDIMGGLDQPVSNVRFPLIAQKASELINEVKAMGNALLSSIEKGEAEKLTLIRQEQEIKILELSQDIKYLQWKESESSIESLLKTRESAYQRYRHYQTLLGKEEGDFSELKDLIIEGKELNEENFDDVYDELVEKYGQNIDLEEYREEKLGFIETVGEIGANIAISSDDISNNLSLNKGEELELNVYGPLSTEFEVSSFLMTSVAAPLLALIPQFDAYGAPLGVGVSTGFGGVQLSKGAGYAAMGFSKAAEISSKMGAQSLKLASYQRRIDDWTLQSNLAAKELQQIGTQIISSLIREQISQKEYENHKVQIENSHAIDTFLKEQKFSNEELYLWMQGEISKTYYEFYKLAFDTAKKAEATMKHELMRQELNDRQFIKFNYWDAGRKGLLSGEALSLDMKRLELAYMESNKREFEITKHISLVQLNPEALLQLKVSGTCEVAIPEWLYDLDYPGHYMRRIKSVSLSIPAITGPYAGVNCTLSLQKSTLRKTSLLSDDQYSRAPDEDDRFRDYFGTVESIVTSNGQNDSGLFETNLRDERFLPFEGAGAQSTWTLKLSSDLRQFDYDTISDVIFHVNYTAREGGKLLADKATGSIKDMINDKDTSGLVRMFSLKHDFPNEWHQFLGSDKDFKALLKKEHFPYFVQSNTLSVQELELIAVPDFTKESLNIDIDALNDNIASVEKAEISLAANDVLKRDGESDVFLLIRYTLEGV